MKRVLLIILAIFFPWLVLLIQDNPAGALLALILQASIIGWIPATIWAMKVSAANKGRKAPNPDADSSENRVEK